MNKHYVREIQDEQDRINSDFDETSRFGEGVGLVIGFALLLVFLAFCATWPNKAHGQTIAAPTRTTPYDWACLDGTGAVLSTHQRFDTAFVACYNNPAGVTVQGGAYKLAARTTTPPPVTCAPAPASSTRTQQCPAGTTGTWQQTSTSTVGPAPSCTVSTSWTPTDAPAGACTAAPPPTPNAPAGLTASIAPNQSNPANSNVTLTWTAIAGVDKYECHRCAGATCTSFGYVAPDASSNSWLNANLPPGLTYRYKCRAFAPVTGPFSDIVNVTTPTATQPPPQANGTATIEWEAPTANTDGSPLTNLAGFHIAYGTAADALVSTVDVPNAALRVFVVDKLASGTWYFAVRAYASTGAESGLSNVASKVVP